MRIQPGHPEMRLCPSPRPLKLQPAEEPENKSKACTSLTQPPYPHPATAHTPGLPAACGPQPGPLTSGGSCVERAPRRGAVAVRQLVSAPGNRAARGCGHSERDEEEGSSWCWGRRAQRSLRRTLSTTCGLSNNTKTTSRPGRGTRRQSTRQSRPYLQGRKPQAQQKLE